jgi:hypothetical protein
MLVYIRYDIFVQFVDCQNGVLVGSPDSNCTKRPRQSASYKAAAITRI